MGAGQFVNVDYVGLDQMRSKIEDQREALLKMSDKIKQQMHDLNNSGFKDAKFNELQRRIDECEKEFRNLIRFMETYASHLKQLSRDIQNYLATQKL